MSKLLAAMLLLTPALAVGQVEVRLALPELHFSVPPPLVVVTPGVQVVPDHDDEVFFVERHYWVRRDGRWFRSRDHRGGWVHVDHPHVPRSIYEVPSGKYRRWKHHRKQHRYEKQHRRDRDDHRGKHKHKGKGRHG